MAMLGETAIVTRWFEEVWNNGRESAIDELAAPDVLFHTLRGGFRGTDAFKRFHQALRQQIADLHFEIFHAIGVGDLQAVHCRVSGRQRSTGKPVGFVGGGIGRIKDGRLVEAWDAWSFMDLAESMEIIPERTFERVLGFA